MLAMRTTSGRWPLVTVVAMALATAVAGCTGSVGARGGQPGVASTTLPTSGRMPSATPSVSPSPWPVVVPVTPALAGQHQTRARPTAQSSEFQAEMTDLWAGIVSGRPALAMPSFFPLVAYEQVKAIANPAADWQRRLVGEFVEDVAAAHRLIGNQARQASLVEVIVPDRDAGWINPGFCANGVGYWHVANARLVYRVDGRIKSFGISTLISWRGRWYVVHLGGELRTSSGGMVDRPASGPGVPGPQNGC
jgi:hypothetical protein